MESEQTERNPLRAKDSGTFIGHIGPGCFFFFLGCLWTYNALFRYHVARRQVVLKGSDASKLSYKNTLFSKYHSSWAQAAPVEPIFVLLVAIAACIGEIITFHKGMPVITALHHMFMFSLFGLVGVIQILHHYRFAMPPSSEYAVFIIAQGVSAFLLSNHIFGREIVNRQMHMILVYFNMIVIMCVTAEIIYNRNVTVALGRTLFLTAQGMWLCATAFIVYPLPSMHGYDLNDHTLMDIVSSLGIVVIAIVLIIIFTMNLIISNRVKNMNVATANRIVAHTNYRRISAGSKGEAASPLISDSDYEV